jgi:hypothetical protein
MKKLWILLFFSVLPLFAQTDRATLTGTVKDSSGARVASVDVIIMNLATGTESHTRTNGEGVYTLSSLATGSYKVKFVLAGFATQEVEDLKLDVGETRSLSISLTPANVSTTIEVRSADSGLSENSAEIGGVIQGSQAQDLPLNGRNLCKSRRTRSWRHRLRHGNTGPGPLRWSLGRRQQLASGRHRQLRHQPSVSKGCHSPAALYRVHR